MEEIVIDDFLELRKYINPEIGVPQLEDRKHRQVKKKFTHMHIGIKL